jgi:hypothetical protein
MFALRFGLVLIKIQLIINTSAKGCVYFIQNKLGWGRRLEYSVKTKLWISCQEGWNTLPYQSILFVLHVF